MVYVNIVGADSPECRSAASSAEGRSRIGSVAPMSSEQEAHPDCRLPGFVSRRHRGRRETRAGQLPARSAAAPYRRGMTEFKAKARPTIRGEQIFLGAGAHVDELRRLRRGSRRERGSGRAAFHRLGRTRADRSPDAIVRASVSN